VAKIEFGARTGDLLRATEGEIVKIKKTAAAYNPDSLILGCTHFASVEGIIAEALPWVKIVNPARLGAMEMADQIELSGMNLRERGRVIYM
jgi:glutamate racemase